MRSLLLTAFLALFLAGCARIPARWDSLDLRLLDPADDAPSPETDLIALYAREDRTGSEVRVDFLDLVDGRPSTVPAVQLPDRVYFAFDTSPGGSRALPGTDIATDIEWDVLVAVPTPNTAQILLPDGALPRPGLAVDATYNYPQDYLTVRLPQGLVPEDFQFQVFTLSPSGLADSTSPVAGDAAPPPGARLLLSFHDVFPAALPAQALRRWDGAHTGPYGERHGLHPLLEAARRNRIPLTLLDLRTPTSLSALDIVGGLGEVRQMQQEGLLTIPDAGYSLDAETSIALSQAAGRSFGLEPVQMLYTITGFPGPGYNVQFAHLADDAHIAQDSKLSLILIPFSLGGDEQIRADGPTLETRRALLASAMSDDPADLVSLGGSLPASAWGDSDAAEAAMEYIIAHPWISPLSATAAVSLPAIQSDYPIDAPLPATYPRYSSPGVGAGLDSTALAAHLHSQLLNAHPGSLTDAAWDMFFVLSSPSDDPKQEALQAQYLGEVGILQAASQWAESPAPRASCDADLDYDLIDECILATDRLFAVFERDGGRLAYLFSLDDAGQPHQLVGGTDQFVAGLSDRSQWRIEQGPAADPGQISGAFVDADVPWLLYAVSSLGPDSLTLTSTDGQRMKSFRLLSDAVSCEYGLREPVPARFALTLDPWLRFHQGWGSGYYGRVGDDRVTWSVRGGPSVSIQAEGRTGFSASNDTIDWLYGPEDPNQGFAPGHYLPFPMAVADFEVHDGAKFILRLK